MTIFNHKDSRIDNCIYIPCDCNISIYKQDYDIFYTVDLLKSFLFIKIIPIKFYIYHYVIIYNIFYKIFLNMRDIEVVSFTLRALNLHNFRLDTFLNNHSLLSINFVLWSNILILFYQKDFYRTVCLNSFLFYIINQDILQFLIYLFVHRHVFLNNFYKKDDHIHIIYLILIL
jgi:hypothetical protein